MNHSQIDQPQATAQHEAGKLWAYDFARCEAGTGYASEAVRAGRCGILGIDEAGRGSWAGPVVAAAACLRPEAYRLPQLQTHCAKINDSKKLSRANRDELFALIEHWRTEGLLLVCAAEGSVAEIADHNILGATALAMRRAVEGLYLPGALPQGESIKVGGKRPAAPRGQQPQTPTQAQASAQTPQHRRESPQQGDLFAAAEATNAASTANAAPTPTTAACSANAAVATTIARSIPPVGLPTTDGSPAAETGANGQSFLPPLVLVDGLPMPTRLPWAHEGLVGGDGISLAIAIASIWAKVTRDRLMERLHADFPQYGWAANCGYGTAAHIRALREHGPGPHHRAAFLRKLSLD